MKSLSVNWSLPTAMTFRLEWTPRSLVICSFSDTSTRTPVGSGGSLLRMNPKKSPRIEKEPLIPTQPARSRIDAAMTLLLLKRDEDGDQAASLGERGERLPEDGAEVPRTVDRLPRVARCGRGSEQVADLD